MITVSGIKELKKRLPNVKVTRKVIKCHEDVVITEEIKAF